MIKGIPADKKIILFDGVCNLCNYSVLKVLKYDKKEQFVFASLQSDIGKKIMTYLQINPKKIDSIILYEPTITYDIKSSAALKIMNGFGGLWKMTQIFWLFPRAIRDFFYDIIAKHRYKWFGKRESCMLPTEKLKSKFL